MSNQTVLNELKRMEHNHTLTASEYKAMQEAIFSVKERARLEFAIDNLKEMIEGIKANYISENQDCYTGYMSAMSTVEGFLAEYKL